MRSQRRWVAALAAWLFLVGIVRPEPLLLAKARETPKTKVAIVVGPSTHPPGTHEVAAGARLLKHCLENPANARPIRAEVFDRWPGKSALGDVATIVFTGDLFPPERMDRPEQVKAELGALMDRGCGLVCLHYATGLRAPHVAQNGDHPLLKWLGGYYSSGCPHHKSVARVVTATISPEQGPHPVLRGWKTFTLEDEPYWNNYFGKDGPARNVSSVAYAMLPANQPKKETVAWAVDRADGGRGVGIVMPHFFRSWQSDDLRTLVLNGIFWCAKADVPADGVKASLPELSSFKPESVEPRPRP